MKKLISLVTAILLLFQIAPCFAADTVVYVNADCSDLIFQAGSFSGPQSYPGQVHLNSLYDNQAAYDMILNGLKNRDPIIYMHTLNIPFDFADASETYSRIINDHPELCYVTSSIMIGYMPIGSTGILYTFEPMYVDEIGSAEVESFNNKVEYIISSCTTDSMTDEEKALALHDYIVDTCEYGSVPPGGDNSQIDWIAHTAYGAISRRKSVCQGYALAYKLLMNKVGIECYFVASKPMEHAWNVVKIDGEWYHVDATWDDPTNYTLVNHEFFLRSDEYFLTPDSYGDYHHSWDAFAPACTSDKYDGNTFPFRKQILPFKYLDGYFWYGGENAVGYTVPYTKTNFDGTDFTFIPYSDYLPDQMKDFRAYAPVSYSDQKRTVTTKSNLNGSTVVVDNLTGESRTAYVFIAVYSGDTLVDISAKTVLLGANEFKIVPLDKDVSNSEKTKIIIINDDYEELSKAYQY